MAKRTFKILETFFSNKNPNKEIQIQALDKAYIVCHKDYNLFLKCRYNFNNIVGSQSRKYIACYYLQKGSAELQAERYNMQLGKEVFIVKEMTFTADNQITLKTLD
jgi:hypothetical protein